jgi:hypothetical protein
VAQNETAPLPPRSTEEPAEIARVVEHHRLDASTSLRRSLGAGALVVSVGALVMGIALALPRLDPARAPNPWARRAPSAALFEVDAQGVPVAHRSTPLERVLGIVGLVCVVAGGLTTIVGLRRVLSEESYLALRTDGAYFRRGREASLLPWHEVEEVRWDEREKVVRFVRHDGSEWSRGERFAGIDGPELARRAAEVRRKALFGLLS